MKNWVISGALIASMYCGVAGATLIQNGSFENGLSGSWTGNHTGQVDHGNQGPVPGCNNPEVARDGTEYCAPDGHKFVTMGTNGNDLDLPDSLSALEVEPYGSWLYSNEFIAAAGAKVGFNWAMMCPKDNGKSIKDCGTNATSWFYIMNDTGAVVHQAALSTLASIGEFAPDGDTGCEGINGNEGCSGTVSAWEFYNYSFLSGGNYRLGWVLNVSDKKDTVQLLLDNVSVTNPTVSVPEPSPLGLLIMVLVGIAMFTSTRKYLLKKQASYHK